MRAALVLALAAVGCDASSARSVDRPPPAASAPKLTHEPLTAWTPASLPFDRSETIDLQGCGSPNPVIADLDGDGRIDIAAVFGGGRFHTFGGGPSLAGVRALTGVTWRSVPPAALGGVAIDVDGDGSSELIYGDGKALVIARASAATFTELGRIAVAGAPIAAADLDGDGLTDLLAADAFNQIIAVLRRAGGFATPAIIAAVGPHEGIDVGDFDGDGAPDLVVFTPESVTVWRNDGHAGFTSLGARALLQPEVGGGGPVGWALGDFDGDGRLDVLAGGTHAAFLRGDGNGGFARVEEPDLDGVAIEAALDADGDGRLDVATLTTSSELAIALGGASGFSAPAILGRVGGTLPWIEVAITARDLDGDGRTDLIALGSGLTIFHHR